MAYSRNEIMYDSWYGIWDKLLINYFLPHIPSVIDMLEIKISPLAYTS